MGTRQCVLNASHILSYVSMSVDRCAGPCFLFLGRFSTSPVQMNSGVLCVCEYDLQGCKMCVWFVYDCVILETVVHPLVKERDRQQLSDVCTWSLRQNP